MIAVAQSLSAFKRILQIRETPLQIGFFRKEVMVMQLKIITTSPLYRAYRAKGL